MKADIIEQKLKISAQWSFLAGITKTLESLIEKRNKEILKIAVFGEFSSGKTSLLNSLFGLEMPISVLPETSSIWEIRTNATDEKSFEVVLKDGTTKILSEFPEIKSISNDKIDYIKLNLPSSKGFDGIYILDTPGISSGQVLHREVLERHMPDVDVILITVDINQGTINNSTFEILKQMELMEKIFYIVLTKSDTKSIGEVNEVKDYISKITKDIDCKGIVTTSATANDVTQMYDILKEIYTNKKAFIEKSISKKFIYTCNEALSLIDLQLNNASLDIKDILSKKEEIRKELEKVEKQIREKEKELEKNFELLADDARIMFEACIKRNIDKIVDAIYDDNPSEDIEDRFSQITNDCAQRALEGLGGELHKIADKLEAEFSIFTQDFKLGDSAYSIKFAEMFINFRDFISSTITTILSIKVPILKKLFVFINGFIRTVLTKGIATFTRKYIKDQLEEIIDRDVVPAFKDIISRRLQRDRERYFGEYISELINKQKNLELALSDLVDQKREREKQFSEYLDSLRHLREEFNNLEEVQA